MKTNLVRAEGKQTRKSDIIKLLEPFDFKITTQVFIKPNLAVPASPASGIVTDVKLISLLVDFLRDKGIEKIFIGEGPIIGHQASDVFAATGYETLAREKDFELVDLNTTERKPVKWHYGEIDIPKIVLNSFYINVAKLKTHVQTTVTLSMKNQKGILLPIDKRRFHRDYGLHWPIAYLAEVIKPNLAIIDGVIGLEGDGPILGGSPRHAGLLAAGCDIVALDSACCCAIGIDPYNVLHLKYAMEIGVGSITTADSSIIPSNVKINFKRANENFKKIGKLYSIRNPYACTGCGDSVASAIQYMKSTPKMWPRLAMKMGSRALVGGMVILTGKNASPCGLKGKKICVGNCTQSLAKVKGLRFVPGCPPKPEDVVKAMLE
jgi:uncharacterized protein (DUF362 family)